MSKASKHRPCPALGRDISSADCGEQRQSRLACPPDCPHNPFAPANYSQLLEIEDRLDAQTVKRLAALAPDRAALQRDIDQAHRQGVVGAHAFYAWHFFFATDASQTTFAQRWQQSGLRELKNDERVLLRAKTRMHIGLLEIHRVMPDGWVEAVDLLSANPTPMILRDRSLAGIAVRFSIFLTWIFPLPHYWRVSGGALILPGVPEFSAPEIVREIVRHLGGSVAETEMRRWLAEHFLKFDAAQHAVARLRHRQMLAGMDAKFGKAVYELRAPFALCRERLEASPNVEPDDLSAAEQDEGFAEARVWFDHAPVTKTVTLPGGAMILGRILLGQSLWRLETFGAEKLSRLRRQFEQQLGEHVCFSGERVDDLGARLSGREPIANESLAPPRLLENPTQWQMFSSRVPELPPGVSPEDAESALLSAAERAFLDDQIPALDNRTPREAAHDPVLRPKLVQLMKQRVRGHDERNLQTGRADDINWLLHELELKEIIFDAPPWRPPPPRPADDKNEADLWDTPDQEGSFSRDPNRPPPPRLPEAPLDLEEAFDRLQAAMDSFQTAAEAEEELIASGSTLLADAGQLTRGILPEQDFYSAVPFLLQAWFAFVPRGCRAPEISFTSLERTFLANLREIHAAAKGVSSKKLEVFFKSGPQPEFMMALLGEFLEAANTVPKEIRPTLAAQPVILALLKSVMESLDEALR